jgi:hypothetical protein
MLKYHADLDINQHNSISGVCTYLPTYNYDDTREYIRIVYRGMVFTVFAPLPAYFSDTGFGDYSWYSRQ